MLFKLYAYIINLAKHQKAPLLLAIVSFIESSILPVPPDVMLAPMSIAQPKSIWKYAGIATVFSVLGGIFGYYLGFIWANYMLQLINKVGYYQYYLNFQQLFSKWGLIAVILAGFTPIPYKIFTIGSGLLKFNLLTFIFGSIIGRGLRFFMISTILRFHGVILDKFIRDFLNKYGKMLSIIIILLIFSYFLYKLFYIFVI